MNQLRTIRGKGKDPKKSKDMVIYRSVNHIIPPKFINIIKTYFTGTTAVTTTLTQAWAQVYFNSIVAPFNPGQPVTTNAAGHGFVVVASNGTAISNNPDGYTTLISLYETYRVIKSKLVIRLRLTNTSDVFMLTLSAAGFDGAQSGQLTPNTANAQPFFKSTTLQAGVSNEGNKKNELVLETVPWKVLGLSESQYMDLPVALINANPVGTSLIYFQMNLFPLAGTTNSGILGWEFELTQDVEWSTPLDFA